MPCRLQNVKVLFIAPGDSLHTKRWINRVAQEGVDCLFYDMEPVEKRIPGPWPKIFDVQISRIGLLTKKLFDYFGLIGSIPKSILITLLHFKTIRSVVKTEKPDLIHLQWLYHPAALALSLMRNSPPIIATPWGSDVLTPEYKRTAARFKKFINKIVTRRIVRKSDAYCCDAQHMAKALIYLGALAENIRIIFFGTDTNVFSPKRRNSTFWQPFGLVSESIKVISNRVLADMYDIETFIRAAKIISETRDEVDFILVGGGPKLEHLKEYSSTMGPHRGITFTGRLDDEDFATATCSADIYVSTSPTDGGLAASVAEAMSAAIPVVITNFGDNSYWLKSERAGFLFEPGNEKELASKILALIDDPVGRAKMGTYGRSIIEQENNSELETKKVIELYESIAV